MVSSGAYKYGLMVTPPLDTFDLFLNIDDSTFKQPGISGSMTIKDHTTLIIDAFELAKVVMPELFL